MDATVVFFRRGPDSVDSGNPGHRAFKKGYDLGVHGLRRCAGEVDAYTDDGLVHVRQFAHLDGDQRSQAREDYEQVDDQHEYRPADTQARQVIALHLVHSIGSSADQRASE